MEMTRERISLTFDPRDMLLSLQLGFSFVRAAVACAILERTSGLEPSSETTAPRHLKLVTEPNFCSFTFISLWMPLALFVLSRWTEYCSELYNYESCRDNAELDCSQPPKEDLQQILREEVEIAVASLKKGKSVGVDNIPAELVQAGGETMIDVLTEFCNRIWRTGEWPAQWTQSLIITLPKKGTLQLCQNYRTISLISHSSKVMLKVISNRLKPQAEEIIAKEQTGFRAGRSTTEQIFNLRILCEKYKICTMSSLISKKPLTEYGMQPFGPPCEVQYQCKSSSHH